MTTDDGDWVQDVKRWYLSNLPVEMQSAQETLRAPQGSDLGYEAAQPTLHPANWSKPKRTEFGTLR